VSVTEDAGPSWDDGRWSPLPQLQQEVHADVCVVGLGGSGLTAIDALLDHGMTVVGIDAGGIAGGAAGRNGGFLLAGLARFHHEMVELLGRQRAAALYHLTVAEIDRIARVEAAQVRRRGSLRIAVDAEELADCEVQLAALRADDLPAERYEGPEGQGLLIPTDASFNPLLRCRALAASAIARGAQLFENTATSRLDPGRVEALHGRVLAAHIIVAIDGKLDRVLPELQGRVRTARLQMLGTAPTREVAFTRPVYARYGYDYWQQTTDHRIVMGGFRDTQLDAEWTTMTGVTEAIQKQLERQLRDRLGVTAPITNRWAASVGYTVDGLPVLDEVRPGIWALGGYNGTGNIVGALCARAVVDLILTGRSTFAALLAGGK
jgi:gamma-glutamylputrescine oxidase